MLSTSYEGIKLQKACAEPFFRTPAEGARTVVFLATDESVKEITGEYFYKCKIAKSSKRSHDMEAAARQRELSERMVGL